MCDSFCVSTFSFGHGCRSFCREFYEQSTVVDEMRVLQLFVFFVPTMFSGILGFFGRNSTVMSPFWSACKHSCCTISLVSRVLHVFSISLCGFFFLEPLFARVGVLFMYMGARESCLRACATLLCHARVKTIGTSLCLTSSSLIVSLPLSLKDLDPRILLS